MINKTTLLSLLLLLGICLTSLIGAAEVQKKKVIYFIQGHWGNFFDPNNLASMRQAGYDLEPWIRLHTLAAEAGYDLRIAERDAPSLTDVSRQPIEEFEAIVVFEVFPHQLAYLAQYPKEKLILFLWEPPSVIPENYNPENHQIFSKVYTWNDALVDNKKYIKFHYPVLHPYEADSTDFNAKKLCALIATNRHSFDPNELYSERRKVADFYEKNHREDFDLFGRAWPVEYKTNRGPIGNKAMLLRLYKFCYSYENIRGVPGYITEKIFDCFQAGCVPIYWGAPNISQYIPKECFIARDDFASDEELYQFLKGMGREKHEEYVKHIRTFLQSEQAQAFSGDRFVQLMMDLIVNHPKSSQ